MTAENPITEDFARDNFEEIAINKEQWKVLYRDTSSGQLWLQYYPHASAHGGGPPVFVEINLDDARQQFGSALPSN